MHYFNEKFSKGFLFALFILITSTVHGVSVPVISMGSLSSVLYESSGVDFSGGTHFWTMNDTYGDNHLYRIADDGSLTKTIEVTNAQNRNWEDITHDAARTHLFIGDFGNNDCDRTNLRVWRIAYPTSSSPATVTADEIAFTYPDQHHFPSPWMNFDAEAFIEFQGTLYIFTKADGSAVGYTKMYSLPTTPGTYVATLVDSFYTNDRTTGAALSPDQHTLILMSNSHLHLFRNFTGSDFFGGQHTQISIAGSWTQKEGVTFSSNNEVYLTDENNGSGNHLYYISLSQWIPASAVTTSIETINDPAAGVYPNPANDFVNISLKNVSDSRTSISLYDITGKVIYDARIEDPFSVFTIRTSEYPAGVYFYKIFSDAKEAITSRLIISH